MTASLILTALAGLLFAPGPTNMVLALDGAARGRAALAGIAAVLLAYALTILPLSTLGAGLVAGHALFQRGLSLTAGFWVGWLALRLWQAAPDRRDRSGGLQNLFVTTLLNPKGPMIGLVLLPKAPAGSFGLVLAGCFVLIAAASASWCLGGLLLGRTAGGRLPRRVRRLAAFYLGLVGAGLVAGVL